MTKPSRITAVFLLTFLLLHPSAHALSVRHHLYNMGRNLIGVVKEPVRGIFVRGPKNIHQTYQYEVWGREDVEERGRFRHKLFAAWRAPGDELKGIIDGTVDGIVNLGDFLKEFLSIFFSD